MAPHHRSATKHTNKEVLVTVAITLYNYNKLKEIASNFLVRMFHRPRFNRFITEQKEED